MTWTIDPSHSQLGFSVRHMGLSTVRGRFTGFAGRIELDAADEPAAITVDVETASITTDAADRDAHLRSADFFEADAHPTITFRSTAFRPKGDRYEIEGDLTMRGVTRSIVMDAQLGPTINDPFGLQRRAAVGEARINRKDWGLSWNQVLEAGSLLVGEEVTLSIDVQVTAVRTDQPAEATLA